MNVLEWLKASSRYSIEDRSYEKIANDREIGVDEDATTLTIEQRELLVADILFVALILSPSSTSSQTVSHNGFQRVIGSETTRNEKYLADKRFMMSIYERYGDPRYDIIKSTDTPKIKMIKIEDVI